MEDSKSTVKRRETSRRGRSMWGMQRTLVNNLVQGVKDGFTEELEINGVGLRAAMQGKNLQLTLGFSHEVISPIPAGRPDEHSSELLSLMRTSYAVSCLHNKHTYIRRRL